MMNKATHEYDRDKELRLDAIKDRYDLIVVGGGIYGATLAWEAASRGLDVVLIEKNDFGSGTSANSLKIIHGGIRYLQNLNVARVRESARERSVLMRIAPHLVSPLRCVIPTYRWLVKGKGAVRVAFWLYDLITFDRNRGLGSDRHIKPGKIISRAELNVPTPDFVDEEITGWARWYDAQVVNSERLVLSFVMSAREKGAHTYNYLEAVKYITRNNRVTGVVARDFLSSKEVEITSDVIIDCTGPWARWRDGIAWGKKPIETGFVKAVNIVVRHEITPYAVGIKLKPQVSDSTSDRFLFITPWREGSIIGTWYFDGDYWPKKVEISDDELAFCLVQMNRTCPGIQLKISDITLFHVGLLPRLSVGVNQAESALKEKCSIICAKNMGGPTGLYIVEGVKYTTARGVAVKTIDKVSDQIRKKVPPSISHLSPLYGGNISNFTSFVASRLQRYGGRFSQETITRLATNYGTLLDNIIGYADHDATLGELVPGAPAVIKAELVYVLKYEMVHTLSDLLLRRTDIGSFKQPSDEIIDFSTNLLAARFDWDRTTRAANVQELLDHYPK